MPALSNADTHDTPDFLAADGEMAERMRRFDWSRHALGPPAHWSPSLKVMVRMALNTRHPVFIFWGPQLWCLYNDAYSASLGPEKHPALLGMAGVRAWPEIWTIIGPQLEQVMGGGGPTWHENQLVPILRRGAIEDVYWTYSYGPIDDAASPNGIGGVLVLCTETTHQVLSERRHASERERLAVLFEQAPVSIALLRGPDHVFEMANPSYCALVGNRPLLGLSLAQAFPELVDQGYPAIVDRVYRDGEAFTQLGARFELRAGPHAPIDVRHLDYLSHPVRGADGTVEGVVLVAVDVSARHAAEQALSVSEEQLRLATEAAEIGLWDVDPVNHTLFWPPRVKAMFGIAAAAPVSMDDFYAGLHSDDRTAVGAAFAAATDPARRALYDVEYRTVGRDDGRVRWVAAKGRGIFDASGRCVRVLGTAIDVSARKQAEQRLRELNDTLERRVAAALAERKLLADVVEGTDSLIHVIDKRLCWMAVNRAAADEFERNFGVRPHVGMHLPDALAAASDQRALLCELWNQALTGEPFTRTEELGEPQRHRRCYEMRFRALRDAAGHCIGAYQIGIDVTDRLQAQQQLARTEAALHQARKLEAMGKLTGGIAHDFNNLLQAMSGNLELIQRRADQPGQVRHWAERALGALQRGARLTAQLLTFSREQSPKLQSVAVAELLTGLQELLRSTAGRAVNLSMPTPAGELFVHADSTQLEMALLNLVINARDAMPDGGALGLTARARRIDDDIELPAGDYVELQVADSGAGMSEDTAARAFDPFFTTKDVGKGSGLGLSQVYGMAQRAGGRARIDTALGRGTVVSILLRAATAPFQAPRNAADGRTAADAALALLVVDDDADVRRYLLDALQGIGHTVVAAADGAAALRALQQRRFDAAIVDFAMPAMNGAEFARAARARNPQLPMVFITGFANSAAIDAAVGPGVTVLRKPFELGALCASLGELTQPDRSGTI